RRRPRLDHAVGADAHQHLLPADLGHDLRRRRIEPELAALDQLHGGGGGDRLGHRSDPDHAVGPQLAGSAFEDDALVGGGSGRDARYVSPFDGVLQGLGYIHGVPSSERAYASRVASSINSCAAMSRSSSSAVPSSTRSLPISSSTGTASGEMRSSRR